MIARIYGTHTGVYFLCYTRIVRDLLNLYDDDNVFFFLVSCLSSYCSWIATEGHAVWTGFLC